MFRIRTALLLVVICSGAGPELQLLEPNSQSPTQAPVTPLELPMPTGPHSIGTKVYNWVDRSRHEQASKNPSDFRQLVVQVWYPSEDGSGPTAPYVPMLRSYRHVWEDSEFETASRTLTHSRLNAKPMSGMRFPIVLLSHGWDGTRSEYTSITEELASHGYAVFGVDHPYMGRVALPGGVVTEPGESQFHSPSEIVAYYAKDLEFVIGQIAELNRSDPQKTFTGKFDVARIAGIGHSSGFVAISGACKLDSRIKACVNIDAPGFGARDLAGLGQPLLWIRLQKAGAVPAEYLKTAKAAVYELHIEGANHGSVEDWDFLEAVSPARRAAAANVLQIIEQHVEAFFSRHLDRQNASLPNAGSNKPALQWKVYSPVASPSRSRQP